jgi:hypothetical protein
MPGCFFLTQGSPLVRLGLGYDRAALASFSSFSHSMIWAEPITRLGKCGLMVPAVILRASARRDFANTFASNSFENVSEWRGILLVRDTGRGVDSTHTKCCRTSGGPPRLLHDCTECARP